MTEATTITALTRLGRRLLPVITVASIGFVGWVAVGNFNQLADLRPRSDALAVSVLFAAIYGGALFLVAENWHRMLRVAGGGGLGRRRNFGIFADTQIAKYLPGNVGHLLTRHFRLKGEDRTHAILFRAFLFESAAMVVTAALIAGLFLSLFPMSDSQTPWIENNPLALLIGAAVLIAGYAALIFRFRAAVAEVTAALAALAVFFALSGLAFYGISKLIVPQAGPGLAGLAVIAWIAGFVVPGAPGGLGPREAALLALSAPSLGEPAALLAIGLYRLTTLVGDLICFGVGRALLRGPP